jgi:lipopolysaccharide/colanic/teichoic acid biosynthesis glycosyltransferase
VLLSPVLIVMAILIKLTSRGPVFYRGTVIGRYGRPFTYYKFRTMRADSDNSLHRKFIEQYVAEGQPASGERNEAKVYKLLDDPRITTVGRWLRRTSLDEMAQMFNVLRGDMSVVGPRPPVPYEYEHYTSYHHQRLDVPPGITGLAQVRVRSRASFEEMVAIDLEYIRRRSIRQDLAIMLETVWVMISGRGAH